MRLLFIIKFVRAIFKFISVIFTVLFLLFGFLAVKDQLQYKDYVKCQAVVLDSYDKPSSGGSDDHYAVVHYTYDGTEYTQEYRVWRAYYNMIGSEITVKCDPNDPTQLNDSGDLLLYIILGSVFGIVSLIFGLVDLILKKLSKKILGG